MLTREQIQEILQPLRDPDTGKSLMELQRIRDIVVKENTVRLSVIYSSEEIRATLEAQIKELLEAMGATEIYIRMKPLDTGSAGTSQQEEPSDRDKLTKGHAAGMEGNSLLSEQSGVHFIAIASGKGGVGKSTVTVNLAAALARQGKRVGLIDADIYGFSVPDMMGMEEGPTVTEDGVIHPVERFGVKVMSMGFFIRENSPVIWRGPMLGKMLRQFFSDVAWGELDYMLLDLPPGTGDVALDVHQMIPQSKEIIVTTPHATAAFVAARAGAMALQTEHEILGVVENMAYYACSHCGEKDYVFGRGGGGKLAETLHTELLAQLPLGGPDNHPSEPDFSPSVYKPGTESGAIYDAIALRITDKLES
ncbi:Mrp/NBP35 family ATP-binding protein [Paenibacillus sp. JCM 10914]|uniref:Mrp/NBP35 family ATP-binding protein n=1 Tax=Paenibacillus sp. JCM 10914 TaxID=1236974 RepID=UPI0003CC49D4|nr:Mrp/NBP35 family ATP-binding protein [Paenibacillus sp. JCM 10914]GAE08876.1 similar to hydrolases or acyltransferases [Paenibacillus sp. JCM 10914]